MPTPTPTRSLRDFLDNHPIPLLFGVVVSILIGLIGFINYVDYLVKKNIDSYVLTTDFKKNITTEPLHVQSGFISNGGVHINDLEWKKLSTIPTDDSSLDRQVTFEVPFAQEFSSTPQIILGIRALDSGCVIENTANGQLSKQRVHAWTDLSNNQEPTKKFYVTIRVWNKCQLNYIELTWLAIGK